jgi:hypothetical protein
MNFSINIFKSLDDESKMIFLNEDQQTTARHDVSWPVVDLDSNQSVLLEELIDISKRNKCPNCHVSYPHFVLIDRNYFDLRVKCEDGETNKNEIRLKNNIEIDVKQMVSDDRKDAESNQIGFHFVDRILSDQNPSLIANRNIYYQNVFYFIDYSNSRSNGSDSNR